MCLFVRVHVINAFGHSMFECASERIIYVFIFDYIFFFPSFLFIFVCDFPFVGSFTFHLCNGS